MPAMRVTEIDGKPMADMSPKGVAAVLGAVQRGKEKNMAKGIGIPTHFQIDATPCAMIEGSVK